MMRHARHSKSGVVLPSVLALIFCGVAIVAALVVHATRSMMLTRRSIDYQRASYLALAGLDAGTAFMKQTVYKTRNWGDFDITSVQRPEALVPDYDNEYETFIRYEDFVGSDSNSDDETLNSGEHLIVVYSASRNKYNGICAVMTNALLVTFSHLGDYAAFYTRDLEAWPGENMTFKGKVHTNGDLYIGADKLLKFDKSVTASGKFYAMRKPDSGYGDTAFVTSSGHVQFKTSENNYADVYSAWGSNQARLIDSSIGDVYWASASDNYYNKQVKTDQNVLTPPISVNDEEHVIIERPLASNATGYNADTEAVKFATKASLTIHIDSEGNLHLLDKDKNEIANPELLMQPAASVSKASTETGKYNVTQSSYTYTDEDGTEHTTDPLPAYQTSNYLYDRRENQAMALVDVYVDEILNSSTLQSYLYPDGLDDDDSAVSGVLYVTSDVTSYKIPEVSTEEQWTGEYTSSADTVTTSSESEKNRYVNDLGYTVKSSHQTTIYYFKGEEVDYNTYSYYYSSRRNRRYCSTSTVTVYVLSGTKTEKLMETVVTTNYTEIPVQPCVRLRNASDLRAGAKDENGAYVGLSIATDLPMYVEGCYNTNGTKGQSGDDCTDKPPSLVAADAVTMLSSNWQDSWRTPDWDGWNGSDATSVRPEDNLNSRVAVETTFNGILMTGIVESNNGTYSGGLQNLFRFHEHWRRNGTLPYNFNGSMICMWTSNIANQPIESSYTYQPPSRPWGWAQMDPPGLPNLTYLEEVGSGRVEDMDVLPSGFPHRDLFKERKAN